MEEDEIRWKASRLKLRKDQLHKGFYVLTDPVEDLGEPEFAPVHRADNELVTLKAFDIDVKAIAPEEDVGGSEGDPLVAVEEAVVISRRFHQRGRFFFDGTVVSGLRTKNGGLDSVLIAHTLETAEDFD